MMSQSRLLTCFEMLDGRFHFDEKMLNTYKRLSRGFKGERLFFEALKHAACSHSYIFDFAFEHDGNQAQIDVVILTGLAVYHLEIKHYAGSYTIQDDHWLLNGKHQIQNPLLQVDRARGLLSILLEAKGINLPIRSYLIFTHPRFQLYNAAPNLPIVYPNRMDDFVKRLNQEPPLQSEHWLKQLAEKRILQSKYEQMPKYSYDEIKKGLFCEGCRGKLTRKSKRTLSCTRCMKKVTTAQAFYQALREFHFLFPDMPITNARLSNWIEDELCRNSVRLNLKKYLSLVAKARASYYE